MYAKVGLMTHEAIFNWDSIKDAYQKIGVKVVDGVNMQLIWARYEPGVPYVLHSHPHEQFSFMLSGKMNLTVGNLTKEISEGDMWHAPPNVIHGGEVLGDEPAIFVDLYSPPNPKLAGLSD